METKIQDGLEKGVSVARVRQVAGSCRRRRNRIQVSELRVAPVVRRQPTGRRHWSKDGKCPHGSFRVALKVRHPETTARFVNLRRDQRECVREARPLRWSVTGSSQVAEDRAGGQGSGSDRGDCSVFSCRAGSVYTTVQSP